VALADGRIGQLGFSFHDEYEAFEEIVNGSDLWSFCQIQYNYMDTENQAGTPRPETRGKQGLGRRGHGAADGRKAPADPPKDVREVMESFPLRRSPVEWALASGSGISRRLSPVVLSGMQHHDTGGRDLSSADPARIASVR